ncbi:MAG: TonB-dependent receptor [Tannerellaceae bacterium]|jgi:TonB-linked SusC/RagA family outer membrane protein|nr:TonB-dependent receptor [Tannerellaceae bacterium]
MKTNIFSFLKFPGSKRVLAFFLLLFFSVYVHTWAQKVTLSRQNVRIIDLFEEVEKQTKTTIGYNESTIDVNRRVSVNLTDESLDQTMAEILKGTNTTYSIQGKQVLIVPVQTQTPQTDKKTVTGTIVDDNGEPVIGANVVEKGTTNGVITDIDGQFSLAVGNNATLQVSFVGYTTRELPVKNQSSFSIALLEDSQTLDEIVVVGYGTMRKSDLTGSTASVKNEILEQRTVTSVGQALSGKVAGVNIATNSGRPGGRATVRIRGNSSISVTNEPLYVVDGVILNVSSPHTSRSDQTALVNGSSPIDYLNPNDIKSVEVLKDASATAIYGARGANGVIMITTKRGEGVSGATVRYDTDFGVGILPGKLDVLNAEEFLRNEELAYQNAAKFDPVGFAAGNYKDPRTKRTDSRLFDADGNPLYDTDWQKETIRNAFSQTHQVSVTNTRGNDSYGLSLGFRSEEGLVVQSALKRYSGRFFMDSEVNKWLKIGGGLSYNYQDERQTDAMGDGGITVGRQMVEALPILPVKYADGTWAGNKDYPGMEGGNNPVHVATDRNYSLETKTMLGNVYANIILMKGLEFRSVLGTNMIDQKVKYYGGKQLIWISSPNGSAWIRNIKNTSWQFENYITYTNTFAQIHRLTAMVGLSWQHVDNAYSRASGSGFQDDFFSYNNLGVATTQQVQSSVDAYGLNSYFARLNYNLKEKYLLTVTGRFDGSSKFGSSNRYAFFPSVGLAWRLSEEAFLKPATFISNLKPRVSYGVTGNSETGPYASQGGLGNYTLIFNGAQSSGIGVSQLANPELKWEKTVQVNGGLDIGLFDNRLNIEVDVYYKKTTDMLLGAPVPASSGYTSIVKNIGSMENKGFEFAINTVNVSTDDFSWETSFNISFNKNKVLELGEGNDDIFPGPDILSNSNNIIRVNEPVGSFYGYKRLGTWGTVEEAEAARYGKKPGDLKLWDKNNDGQINDADRIIIGKGIPDGYGTFSNTFRYKNFDLVVELQYMFGNDILDISKHSAEDRTGIANSYRTILKAWTPENQHTMIAQIRPTGAGYTTNIDSHFVEDGSFIRGRNLLLGYTFPRDLIRKIYLKNLRVYGSVQNFFVLTKYNGYDPEVSDATQSFAQGITVFGYPKPCTFTMGLNVSF